MSAHLQHVLILITGDPRVSARPAEAVRIAAGISAWGRLTVHVVLHGAALQVLDDTRDLVDQAALDRWWPMLGQHGVRVFRSGGHCPERPSPIPAAAPGARACEDLDEAGLAALSARCTCLLRFP